MSVYFISNFIVFDFKLYIDKVGKTWTLMYPTLISDKQENTIFYVTVEKMRVRNGKKQYYYYYAFIHASSRM